ncbi:MAG: hypothetical protein HKN36_02310 [Hellea sp.]|nr:hypothetical protein [Hellea sp.]
MTKFSAVIIMGFLFYGSTSLADVGETGETNTIYGFSQLKGEAIMDAYLNKTMEGVYASYAEDIANDIAPDTFTEYHYDNATSDYEHRSVYGSFKTMGVYTVRKDQLCYSYNAPGKVVGRYCFYVFKSDNCYYHFSADSPVPKNEEDFEAWTSMAYAKEHRNSCLPNIS